MTPTDPYLAADEFAQAAHEGQERKYTHEPFVEHPRRVARTVSELSGSTQNMVKAALLHDTVEDTDATFQDLEEAFNQEIAHLVWELTNPSQSLPAPKPRRAIRKAIDLEHISTASREAQTIKLADRIDNMSGIEGASDSYKQLYVDETRAMIEAIGPANVELATLLHRITNSVEDSIGR